METFFVIVLATFYVTTALYMFHLLTQLDGWRLLDPVSLVIGSLRWNLTVHGLFGSILLPFINLFTLSIYLLGYPVEERPVAQFWFWQGFALVYPAYNWLMLWLHQRTSELSK